jgi:hypothetical protein
VVHLDKLKDSDVRERRRTPTDAALLVPGLGVSAEDRGAVDAEVADGNVGMDERSVDQMRSPTKRRYKH